MCGFLGEYPFGNNLSDSENFTHLLSLSKHRGPDSTKIETGEKYRLGFNRLALLDLTSAGEQPKRSPSKRYHLVYNGEVYNYRELIVQYGLQNLASTSDTEVILHLLDKIGVLETVQKLNGMFAIAIVDTKENELYLTRDFAGIKPLFYGINDLGVVFASQFDQVFKHTWFADKLELRPEIIREYFAFGYMQAPNTVFEHIFQVNPGELLKVARDGKTIRKTILHFQKESLLNNHYNIANCKKALQKAVKLQLNSDRPLASFLSGGVDSTLVTGYAKEIKEDIEGFTLNVNYEWLNESEFAKSYARHLNLNHTMVEVDENELLSIVEEHLDAFSEPFGDYSSIPTYMVTKKAAQYHTAMLSGDGGDELFWGYPRMYDVLKKAWWFKLPLFLRKNLARVTNRFGITNTFAPFTKSLEQFCMDKHIKLPSEVLDSVFKTGYSVEMSSNLYHLDRKYSKRQLQQFLRWNEFYGHMQRVLIKVDRTSMKNSLEVRVPFLDKDVIEESWKTYFPIKDKSDLKKPLKNLIYQIIPKNVTMQKKKGFSVPIVLWLRNQLKPDLIKTVLDSELYGNEHFDQAILKEFVHSFLEGKHNNGWGVWHIYVWQKWANKFIPK